MRLPDLSDKYALENDSGMLKLCKFMNGDDSAEPDQFDDIANVRRVATEFAKRALRYVAKCDLVEHALEQTSTERKESDG